MWLFSWNFSWVSRVAKVGWEFCAKGISRPVLVTENCSKNTAPISLQMLPGRRPVSTASSTSSSFPPANPHLTLEGGKLQCLDHSGPPGNVTCNCCFLKVTAFHLGCPVPKWQWHFTAYLHTRWSRFWPAVAVLALSFLFYSNYSVPCFLASACAAGIRDPWQLLGLWAWRLMEIESTQCFLLCSLTDDSAQLQKNGCKIWDFG